MKNRIAKKWAKAFIEGRYPNKFSTEIYPHTDYTSEYAVLPPKVARWVYRYACRMGWDGCHWDDPLILSRETYCHDEEVTIVNRADRVEYDRNRGRVWNDVSVTEW